MSELQKETNKNQEPTKADQLKAGIDDLFSKYPDSIERGGIVRKFEEEVVLDASPDAFDEAPTATRLIVSRPIPGQEKEALEKWSMFGGTRVSIFENPGQGHIQTDFRIDGNDVLKRQRIDYPGDMSPLGGESLSGHINRRAHELSGDALSLTAMDGISRAQEVKKRNQGEVADSKVVDELIGWLATAKPADISRYNT